MLDPRTRLTFDSRGIKQIAAAMRVAVPDSEPIILQAFDPQLPDATMPTYDAMLVDITIQHEDFKSKLFFILLHYLFSVYSIPSRVFIMYERLRRWLWSQAQRECVMSFFMVQMKQSGTNGMSSLLRCMPWRVSWCGPDVRWGRRPCARGDTDRYVE